MQGTFPGGAESGTLEFCVDKPRSLLRWLRDSTRRALYRTGLLSLYHQLRNRQTLTVVAFHRVLKRHDPRWKTALVPWTISDDMFDACLAFLKRHYTVVTLDEVKASLKCTRPLPPRSLLITFDDGFADNSEYALPLLRKHGVSATVFISSDVIGRDRRPWTEDLLWAFSAGLVHQRELAKLHALLGDGSSFDPEDPKLIWDIVRRGPAIEEARVEAALSSLQIELHRIRQPRQMLNAEEIVTLLAAGISIGAHGKSHVALPFSANILTELYWPRIVLNDVAAGHTREPVDTLSCPHGAYTPEIVERALAGGYTIVFTSDASLCVLDNGFLPSPVVGRIDVDTRRVAPGGSFRAEMLATTCFGATRRREKGPRKRFKPLPSPSPTAPGAQGAPGGPPGACQHATVEPMTSGASQVG
jgi:peptidoglycan/xylan/chitin deacetylase (PgdA/CDA1 family)